MIEEIIETINIVDTKWYFVKLSNKKTQWIKYDELKKIYDENDDLFSDDSEEEYWKDEYERN